MLRMISFLNQILIK